MRKIIFTIVMTLYTNIGFGQEITKTETKSNDLKLVGCWKGSEIGQQRL